MLERRDEKKKAYNCRDKTVNAKSMDEADL